MDYVRGTPVEGLYFHHESEEGATGKLSFCSDVSLHTDRIHGRFQYGYFILFNGAPILVVSKLHRCAADGTNWAEWIALPYPKESNHSWFCEGYYKRPGIPRHLRVAPNCPGTSQTRTTTLSTANSTAKEPGGRERAKFAKRLPCSKLPKHTTYGGDKTLDRLSCASSKRATILRISSRRI